VALAGQVIASHYAEPVERKLSITAMLRCGPSPETDSIAKLDAGEAFQMLDDSLGWAWGYAGQDRRVGYLPNEVLAKD